MKATGIAAMVIAGLIPLSPAMAAEDGLTTDRPKGCDSAESHQLDFWLGEWDVSTTGHKSVIAEASLASADQGCVILEDWRPFADAHGHGLFAYDARKGKWRHVFADASGVWAVMEGGFADGVMSLAILEPPPSARFPADMKRRINYRRLDANTVRQWNQRLDPASHQWVTFEDLTFHRRGAK